jgi:hypothetical protein
MNRASLTLCLLGRDVRPDLASGFSRTTGDLAEALVAEGHRVHLLTEYPAPAPELHGVSITPVVIAPAAGPFTGAPRESAAHNLMFGAAAYREVSRIHEQEGPVDAVIAPVWRSEGAVCVLDDRFPTIVSCMTSLRTLLDIDQRYRCEPDIAERLALEQAALARTRYLHGLTEAVLTKTIDDHDLAPAATAVIGRGLHDRWRPEDAEPRHDGTVEVLFVGRIERRKGVDVLLAAARELIGEGLRFTFAGPDGDPEFRAGLERELGQEPRLRQTVRFVGRVPDPELHRLYAGADIVCVPSRYESHGIVLLEAMMLGRAIVTCDAGGIGEVVDADRNALVAAPDDVAALTHALRRLNADPALRTALGAAARRTFEQRFEARAAARQMAAFVTDLTATHSNGSAGDISGRLGALIQDVLPVTVEEATAAARELLDPAEGSVAAAALAQAREELARSQAELTRSQAQIARQQTQIAKLRDAASAQEELISVLHRRHETLRRVEEGGWWRLRTRLLPLLNLANRLLARRKDSR